MPTSEPLNAPSLSEAAAQIDPGSTKRAGRLGFGFLGVYATGALVETTINFTLTNFLLFYLTIVCGLPGTQADDIRS